MLPCWQFCQSQPSCNGANQLARIQNKTDLIAYVAIQSIQDSVNELKIQEIKPNQTSVLSYEVNGQPKRLAFALGLSLLQQAISPRTLSDRVRGKRYLI